MNAIRKILMPLLIIPLGMFVYVLIYPDWQWESPGFEYLFLLIGLPIVVVNFLAWFYPEILEVYFEMKDDPGQGGNKQVAMATVISTLTALLCVSVGAAFTVGNDRVPPTSKLVYKQTATPAITATAASLSVEPSANPAASNESARVMVTVTSPPSQTPIIPVSGGLPTNTPVFPAAPAETVSPSVEATSTGIVDPLARCAPANQGYLDDIGAALDDEDFDSEVKTGWMVQSRDAASLWFVAAKIHRSNEVTLPGVWALSIYSEGDFDIYAINDIAMEFSYTDWGEDAEPVLTMGNDGAQIAYDCAVSKE